MAKLVKMKYRTVGGDCYGLEDHATDEPFEKCKMCNAFIDNENEEGMDT